jgi:hypothetical protein
MDPFEGMELKPDYKMITLKPNGQLTNESIKFLDKNIGLFDGRKEREFVEHILSKKFPLTEDGATFIDLRLQLAFMLKKLQLDN